MGHNWCQRARPREPFPHLVGAALHTPDGDPAQRLPHDALVHLGLPELTLDEGDRHLDDDEAREDGTAGEVDLEAVAGRLDAGEVEPAQGLGAVDAVAGRGVVDVHAEQRAGCRCCRRR